MFEHIIIFGMNFKEIFLLCILGLLCAFLGVFLCSLYRNRADINFYTLIVRENGRISKVGTSFIFILTLIVYQVVSETEVSMYLVELLGLIFAAELGTKYVDGRLSKKNIENIRKALENTDSKNKSYCAKNIDDIDFDKL